MAKQRSGTVAKAAEVLNQFLDAPQGLTLSQLAQRTGLHKSSILRLCNALTDARLLERDASLTYRVGPGVAALAQNYTQHFRLEDLVRPLLVQLRDHSGESVAFLRRDGDGQLCLYAENARAPLRHHREEGVRESLGRDAAGRLLAAGDRDAPAASLGLAEAGYTLDTGETDGLATIAVPVLGPGSVLHGCLVVSGPATRFDRDQRGSALAELQTAARRLGDRLAARGGPVASPAQAPAAGDAPAERPGLAASGPGNA